MNLEFKVNNQPPLLVEVIISSIFSISKLRKLIRIISTNLFDWLRDVHLFNWLVDPLLEDHAAQQRRHVTGLHLGESVVEDEFGQHQLVIGQFASHPALQLDGLWVVDVVQLFQDLLKSLIFTTIY